MKHTTRFTIVFSIAIIVIVFACKKSKTYSLPSQSLNQQFAGLRPTAQEFSVNAGRDTIIFGASGTAFHFYINSFKDANGNIISTGVINLELVEMYTPGDMIRNRTTTISANDSLLTSGGEINIIATKNGQAVYANSYGLGFRQSAFSNQPMELYYCNNYNSDSPTVWIQGNSANALGSAVLSTDTGTFNIGSNKNPYYIFDSCKGFAGVNCDHLYNPASTPTNVTVIVPDGSFNNSNTEIFIACPSKKALVALGAYYPNSNSFTLGGWSDGNTLPVGLDYELVAITNKNGSYYYFEQSGTITNGLTIHAAMAPETQGDITARLAGL